ncbi:MAG: glycosyltransferase family 39 protein, partial [Pseudomonadota bacterium]|nr:glycosyltransferase family 39 protein [Pseudomonadota bacterium]
MAAASATSDYPRDNGAGGASWTVADRLLLLGLVTLAALRTAALVFSPLELGVDEAQYWLWSTGFDFGYYTKPPLTSWIIGLSHGLFGHYEWAVRLPAPWLHLATSLVLWRAAGWLAGDAAGRIAGIAWMTLPSIGLGSFVISTDTPLLLCWSAGLLALVGVLTGRMRESRGMLLAGGAFGAAMLAKYAAIYGLAGLVIFVLATNM